MKRLISIVMINIIALMGVSGCYLVPKSEVRMDMPIVASFIKKAAIFIQTTSDATEEEMQTLREYLISELESTTLKIISGGDIADKDTAIILVNITEMDRVDFWKRFWGGWTVERAFISAEIVINIKEKEIDRFPVKGESSKAGPMGMTNTALKMAAKAIKERLLTSKIVASKKEAL